MAETSRSDGPGGGNPVDVAAIRDTLEYHLTAAIRRRSSIAVFEAWWERAATTGLLGALTETDDPRGRAAVDLCRAAIEEHRARRVDEEGLLDLLVLAREALRG